MDIGREIREVEFEEIPTEAAPVEEPVQVPVPVPVEEPVGV